MVYNLEFKIGCMNTYRLRVGNYRVIYEKYSDILLILVLDIDHRKGVYKKL
jgi:mRNA interferase RelE/StbE